MKLVRFSISGLLGSVVACGYGIACLRYASAPWAQALYSIALGILVLALVGIACRAGARRAFWAGFAIAGWSYLLIATGPWFHDNLARHLATTRLFDWAYPLVIPKGDRPSADTGFHDFLISQKDPVYSGDVYDLKGVSVRVFECNPADNWRSIVVENAAVGGLPGLQGQVILRVDGEGFQQLQQAHRAGSVFALEPRSPFASLWITSRVGIYEFYEVGHAIVAMCCAWLGGLVGRYSYATRARVH
jgi:hypothetical protein